MIDSGHIAGWILIGFVAGVWMLKFISDLYWDFDRLEKRVVALELKHGWKLTKSPVGKPK